jgi:hypothetical protein
MTLGHSFTARCGALAVAAAVIAAAVVGVESLALSPGALSQIVRAAPLRAHAAAAPKPQKQAEPQKPAPAQKPQAPIALQRALYLIRSTLLTLNDANRSGNYTVLRDLAAPGFQAKNSAADLGRIFADLRTRHVDLSAVALMAPQLTAAPAVEGNGMLRLTGFVPTQPLRIAFDLLFQDVDRSWRLFGISVQAQPVSPEANIPAAPKK